MLQKQAIPINFWQGLDTKTDPYQVQIGKFLSLQNSIFTKGGLLQKRNGYQQLTALPSSGYLTTLNGNLTAIGSVISAYSPGTTSWISKGSIQPLSVSTLPLIRNNINQIQCDAAVAPNGLVCTVYTETTGTATDYKYVIADSNTGQNIIEPTLIPAASSGTITGSARVFLFNGYFIIVFTNDISGTYHLQFIAIPYSNPTTVSTPADISTSYIPSSTVAWDGCVAPTGLYVAYNTIAGGQQVKITYIAPNLGVVSAVSFPLTATLMSLCADVTVPQNPVIYMTTYNSATGDGETTFTVVDKNLNTILVPTLRFTTVNEILNITSAAQNGTATVFIEETNSYSYDNNIPTNTLIKTTVTPAPVPFTSVFSSGATTITVSSTHGLVSGMVIVDETTSTNFTAGTLITTVGASTIGLSIATQGNSASSPGDTLGASTIVGSSCARGVGLASKAFIVNGQIYVLIAYTSPFQNTYFLLNGSQSTQTAPIIAAKLAYENGGGYLTLGLPNVTVTNGVLVQIPYLYKDLIEALAVVGNPQQAAPAPGSGVYSQTGINLATFDFTTADIDTAEIGSNLNISGGFLWNYDGYLPVENGFFLWPDSVKVTTDASATTPTGTVTSGSNIITALSSLIGVGLGTVVTGTAIPSGQTVTAILSSTSVMFGPGVASGNQSGETITFTGAITAQEYFYQFTYEWSDNQGNIYRSAPSIPVSVTTTGSTSSNTLNVPTLRLTYKTANPVKIVGYRWSTANQNYYQFTSVSVPILNNLAVDSIAIVDSLADSSIIGDNIIYTTGGVAEDINGPATNVLTLFDDRLWLIDAEDPNLLWFSKQVIESTPVEMSDLFTYYVAPSTGAQGPTGPLTAIFPMDDKLILFKKDAIYFINGTGPDNTGANSQYSSPYFITSTVGCANQNSIVIIPTLNGSPGGLMFQSDKGIWLLGRDLSTTYIGAPVEVFNSALVNSAIAVPGTNQVRFTLSSGITLMYDYYYQQWGTFIGAPAISSTLYEGLHTYIASNGRVSQESPGIYLDNGSPVLMSFVTSWIALAGLQGYQRAYFFYLLGTYFTPHKLNLQIAYDYNSNPIQSTIISPTNFGPIYGSTAMPVYGQLNPYGGGSADSGASSNIEQWRVFLNKQRCTSFQIALQEIYDPSFGIPAGQGLTLSGLNLVVGIKKGWRAQPAATSAGSTSN